jgi:branched-chain amino acid aminotransferase
MAILPFDQRDGTIWMDGTICDWRDAKVHVLTHGLHYGSCVFDGERSYGGSIFKSVEHSTRFRRSATLLGFDIPYGVPEIEMAKAKVLSLNGGGDQYIRTVAWRGSEMMALGAQQTTIHVAIASWNWPSMFDPARKMKGIKLDIADFRRPDPRCAPVHSKAAGLYMISTLSKHRAADKGYDDALMLDWQDRIAECTGANIFFVKDEAIHTPIADCFLDGITRGTVVDLAMRRGIAVIERRIAPTELSAFEECFICGTAAEITPVSKIGPHTFAPGAITSLMIDDYAAEVTPKALVAGK